MAAGSTNVATPPLTSVYWEVDHLTTNNTLFNTSSGTATLDNSHIRGSFTLPTNVVAGNTGAKTFQIRLYKDSSKTILLAISPITTVGEGLDQTTISKMLWSGLELYGSSPKMDGYEAYLGDPRWLPNGV